MIFAGSFYYYIILCNFAVIVNVSLVYTAGAAGLAAGRRDLLQVAKSADFPCFFCKKGLDNFVITVV